MPEVTFGENRIYDSMTPLEALLNLCIDDGLDTRARRNNVFKSNYYYSGVDTAMHSKYTSMTVIDYSGSWMRQTYTAPTIAIP
jgi:hypothetical protein